MMDKEKAGFDVAALLLEDHFKAEVAWYYFQCFPNPTCFASTPLPHILAALHTINVHPANLACFYRAFVTPEDANIHTESTVRQAFPNQLIYLQRDTAVKPNDCKWLCKLQTGKLTNFIRGFVRLPWKILATCGWQKRTCFGSGVKCAHRQK